MVSGKKRLILLALAALVLFSMAACGTDKTGAYNTGVIAIDKAALDHATVGPAEKSSDGSEETPPAETKTPEEVDVEETPDLQTPQPSVQINGKSNEENTTAKAASTQKPKKDDKKTVAPQKTSIPKAAAKAPAKAKEGSSSPPAATLAIYCKKALENWDKLDPRAQSEKVVPKDGVILKETAVTFAEGDTVYDVLMRTCRSNKINFDNKGNSSYGSRYIEGVNNLYEFDCGPMSGWLYSVNDEFPSYGCSLYKLKNGDKILLQYSCDLGKDIGANQ